MAMVCEQQEFVDSNSCYIVQYSCGHKALDSCSRKINKRITSAEGDFWRSQAQLLVQNRVNFKVRAGCSVSLSSQLTN